METISVDGLTLFFEANERDAAELIRRAAERSVRLIQECWGLEPPDDCRVYVLTSWLRFVFQSAPWPWRILLAVSLPLWQSRVRRVWRVAGGWMQDYGRRQAVGVKPPRLIELADRSMGDRLFVREDDVSQKVQHITCHELTHAFTARLKLPMWLNEGLAMVTVDRFFGKPTIQAETIEMLGGPSHQASPRRYGGVRAEERDAMLYHVARGYWITRYLEDTQPGLLRGLLSERVSHQALEDKVATALGKSRQEFWRDIDAILVSFFKRE
jgi:hypothetical protein